MFYLKDVMSSIKYFKRLIYMESNVTYILQTVPLMKLLKTG